jgi:transposase
MNVRILGIDLAVTAAHEAALLDGESNAFRGTRYRFHTDPQDLERLLTWAGEGAGRPLRLIVIMEATNMSWFPVAVFFQRHGATVYRINGQQTTEERRHYHRRARSDRLDACVLARMYFSAPDRLYPLVLPSASQMALQHACREVGRLTARIVASKNRLTATDQYAWLGSFKGLGVPSHQAICWVRAHWYDPRAVVQAGASTIAQAWLRTQPAERDADTSWTEALVRQAQRVLEVYGSEKVIDYPALQRQLQEEQEYIVEWTAQIHTLQRQAVRPLYHELHASQYLQTLYGVGEASAAVYVAFIGALERFSSLNAFRGWSGMVPYADQSGDRESKGLPITKAGPNLVKRAAYLNANIARRFDPQIAAIYYRQMVELGKCHTQAVCACATHLLNRIFAVLREDRPYVLRNVDGTPLEPQEAREICQTRYQVPEALREQRSVRGRRAQAKERAEKQARKHEAKGNRLLAH